MSSIEKVREGQVGTKGTTMGTEKSTNTCLHKTFGLKSTIII